MRRIHFCLSIGYANADHNEVFEFEDDTTDEQIAEEYEQWCQNYMDGGWWETDEEQS